MGRKVHPIGFRLGVIKDWESKWYAEGEEYARLVTEDIAIRNMIHEKLGRSGISRIEIQRFPKQIAITIATAKPGIVIGRKGSNVNALKADLEQMTAVQGKNLRLDVVEVERPELDARVVAESVVEQLERRVSQKRAMRQAITRAMRAGAKGIRIACSGRLSGAEMARREWAREGRVPLHTLRADIDYAHDEALTTFGRIGVKVWIYRGDVMPEVAQASDGAQGVS
ncbi:MAG TPA: 30S ribosomal protein S3 [Chloroflexi bacterium]|nr:30S ribosomal protein S3 [Chloroflexota bacterium]